MWHHYRAHVFKNLLNKLQQKGDISSDDIDRAKQFFDHDGLPSPSLFHLASRNPAQFSDDPAYHAFKKITEAACLDQITFR